ncbi:hypothetical protein BKA69DRAFT_1078862 [Paraphysoderma sedebokerense]|nr:hypothetical protein BKA69DRAFT_1078862 [Paraphysoderma sedebokerense]
MLQMWLAVLLLVQYTTGTFDMFGCIKGFPCGKHSMPKGLKELIAAGYELIGFMPTNDHIKGKDQKSWVNIRSSGIQDSLGDGAYLFERYSVAKDRIKPTNSKSKPKVCSVFARKETLESLSWIYVPRYVEAYEIANGQYKRYSLYRPPNNLKIYLDVLKLSGKAHSGVLVTDWDDDRFSAGKEYIIKIPESNIDDIFFHCRGLSETPEYLKILEAELKWKEKFGSDWKLTNYPIPMDVTVTKRLPNGMMSWGPPLKMKTKTSVRQEVEGSAMDISRSRSDNKLSIPVGEEKETIETPD